MASKSAKSAYQVILEKIYEMIRQSDGRKFKEGELSPAVRQRLAELEKAVAEFTDLSNKLLGQMGVAPEEAAKMAAEPSQHLSDRDKATMAFGSEVMQAARRRHTQYSILLRNIKARGEHNVRTGETKVLGRARQKKFRRIGGRGDWMPM